MMVLLLLTLIGVIILIILFFGNSLEEPINRLTREILNLQNVSQDFSEIRDNGCNCHSNMCRCCDDSIAKLCVYVGYYEVYDLPLAIGIKMTKDGNSIINVTLDATSLPCYRIPFLDKKAYACFKLSGFEKTSKHVKVSFNLKVKYLFHTLVVQLGCLLVPRLHPQNDMIQNGSSSKEMIVSKALEENGGIQFCSSSSPLDVVPKKMYVLLLIMVPYFLKK